MKGLRDWIFKIKQKFRYLSLVVAFIMSIYGCTMSPSTEITIVDSRDKEGGDIKVSECDVRIFDSLNNILSNQDKMLIKTPELKDPIKCSKPITLKLPIDIRVPDIPVFTEEEINDRYLTEDKLIAYIKELREFIKKLLDDLIAFQEEYNKQK